MDRELVRFVRQRANDRCEYCLMPQSAHLLTFPVDHIIARQHGGDAMGDNLALSCPPCNNYQGPNIAGLDPESGDLTRLFHPRNDKWNLHFRLQEALIVGLTPVGRTTASLLQMNKPDYVELRESLLLEGEFL